MALALVLVLVHARMGALSPRLPQAADVEGAVRFVVWNSRASATDGPAQLRAILEEPADIVALTEPSAALLDAMRASTELRAMYPHWTLPDRARGGFSLLLSRWPVDPAPMDLRTAGVRLSTARRPGGAFRVVLIHPRSPRTPALWRAGNELLTQAIAAAGGLRELEDLPVIIAADLNSAPPGSRSRRMWTEGGYLRARPRLMPGGTFPASWPRIVQTPIDDLWATPGVTRACWRSERWPGSDHQVVVSTLIVPRGEPRSLSPARRGASPPGPLAPDPTP